MEDGVSPAPWWPFLLYFLRLGTFGFGGPIALAGYMQRDLVERRRWISKRDYLQGLALAQLAPGPLAAQLAIYLGWVRAKVGGATLVAAAFILPSFVMVLAISALYVRYGGLPWMQSVFYGVGAAVIAIIARSAVKLVKLTLARDRLLWALFAVSAVATAWTESEIIWLFVASGVVALVVRFPPRWGAPATSALLPVTGLPLALAAAAAPAVSTMTTVSSWPMLGRIALYFAEAGSFVFGSGLAIVPFMHGGVVNQFHWLSERQFLDAVAVAMITPGPVVITVAFIGYLVAGPMGASSASLGVFLPCYLFVIIPAPYFRRFADNPRVKAFVDGVTAAATGAIAGAAFVLGRRALIDLPTIAIAVATWLVFARFKKVPEPLVIVAAGIAGLILRRS
ncbi:MAG TPA: chromate transporter [Polyangia bacterium]|jgi:chromate transporter|nr:chromate transporter [Polyangia bacterium]